MDIPQSSHSKRHTAPATALPHLEGFNSASGFAYRASSEAFTPDSSLSSTASRLSPEAMFTMQHAHREQQGSSLGRSWPKPRPGYEKPGSGVKVCAAESGLMLPTGISVPNFGSGLAKIDEDSLHPCHDSPGGAEAAGEGEPERLDEFSRALGENLNRDGEEGPEPDEEYIPAHQGSPKAPSRRGPRGTSSRYRGVTRHRRTKRWEAHIWDDKKQVYLGGFDIEEHAGKAHDVMALKCRGPGSPLNFGLEEYEELLPMLPNLSKEEVVLLLRRQSKGFVRTSTKFRGVTKDRYMGHRLEPRNEAMRRSKVLYNGSPGSLMYGSHHSGTHEYNAEVQHAAHSLSGLGQFGNVAKQDYEDKMDESSPWGNAANDPWASLNVRSNVSSSHRTYIPSNSALSPGQLLTPNSVGMSPSAQLLRYAAGRDAPSTPLPHNGLPSIDGYGSPTYPSSQPGYLRHRPSPYHKAHHATPAEALFSKEVLDPPSKTDAAGMEWHQGGRDPEGMQVAGTAGEAILPLSPSGGFPSPADYAALLHHDPAHTSQQRVADGGLLWHPSLVSPSLLRTVEAWSGSELQQQVGSPPRNINLITTPTLNTPTPGHFTAGLGDADNESPELNALSSLADAAAIITETGSAGDNTGYGEHDHSSSGLSHGKGL